MHDGSCVRVNQGRTRETPAAVRNLKKFFRAVRSLRSVLILADGQKNVAGSDRSGEPLRKGRQGHAHGCQVPRRRCLSFSRVFLLPSGVEEERAGGQRMKRAGGGGSLYLPHETTGRLDLVQVFGRLGSF